MQDEHEYQPGDNPHGGGEGDQLNVARLKIEEREMQRHRETPPMTGEALFRIFSNNGA